MQSKRLPSLLIAPICVILYLSQLELEAFPTGRLSFRRVLGIRGTPACTTFAIFQDDDCEDLCDAFGEVPSVTGLNKLEEDTTIKDKMISKSFAAPIAPRRSRALWWAGPGPEKCTSCQSGGVMTCRFCGGTSMMSAIGGETDTLFYEGIGKDCPVCDDGVEVCSKCAGTGWVFSWSKDRNRTDSVYP